MSRNNDKQLVKKSQAGDKEAFSTLYKNYRKDMFLFFLSRTNSREDALDLTSELFIKIINSIKGFRFKSTFRTWIYKIARNMLYDFYIQRKKQKNRISLNEEELEYSSSKVNKNMLETKNHKETDPLYKVLDKLPEKYREILTLRYIGNLKFRECAEIMEITENYAKVLHGRAIKKARKYKSVIKNSQSKYKDLIMRILF